jgi:S1-C subfamily serine protease
MSTENLPNLKDNKSIVRIETKRNALFGSSVRSIGSGFFVKPDIILTNIHALTDRGPVLVKSSDGKTTWKVEGVTAFDVRNDIVAIKVAGEGDRRHCP